MTAVTPAQSFGDIRIDGQGNQLVINQIIQISIAEIKTRPLIATSPYVGLARFEERHKDFFFGRDAVIAKLLGMVAARNVVLVTGASGSGKSSLVRSGLLPQLASRLPMGRFRPLLLTPDRDPFVSLRGALLAIGLSQLQTAEVRSDSEVPLAEVLKKLRPPEELWLLFVDQFEEIFTLCSDPRTRARFLDGLSALGHADAGDLKVVLAMRADFFDRLGAHPQIAQLAESGLCMVSDMQASELRAAIEQPAARHGAVFEEGLVEQIIADVRGRPGTLPLLQYTLDLLWHEDKPQDDRTLNTVNYHKIGGIEGALRLRADAIFGRSQGRARPDSEKQAMRRIFLRVVDLTSQGADARAVSKRTQRSEFEKEEDQRLIAELVDEKLLVSNAEVGKEAPAAPSTVELAHEALLSAWPLLGTWIEQAREVLYVRNRLCTDARRWSVEKVKNPSGADEELWGGTRLSQAQELRARGDFRAVLGGLSAEEESFLDAGLSLRERRAREEQQRREQRTRLLRIGIAVLSVFLVIAGAAAYSARKQQKEALAQKRDAIAQKEAAEQRELDMVVEEGRQLLVEKDRALEAVLWLQKAQKRGSRSPALPYLLAQAMLPVDAMRLILRGHWNDVTSASFSPDGSRIVTSSFDNTARLWDAKSGRTLLTLRGHTGAVTSASFSTDGRRIVTSSFDHTARLWDAETGKSLLTLEGHKDGVRSARFSPDDRRIVTTSLDHTARLWDAATGAFQLALQGHTNSVNSASFSPDGRRIVTASWDKTARLWDGSTGRTLLTLQGHTGGVNSASFSPDGRRIVTASGDHTALLWSAETGASLLAFQGHTDEVKSARFSPDGRHIATASQDHTARLWETETGKSLLTLQGHMSDVRSASFSPDGRRIVTASGDHTARLWDADTGKSLLTLQGHSGEVKSTSFSPDGGRILTTSGDHTARLWEAKTGKSLLTLEGHTGFVMNAGFSPDGGRIVTASEDWTARLWDARSGECLLTLREHTNPVNSAGFSPDGGRIVTASEDHTARVWDARTGKSLLTIQGHTKEVTSAGFSPDGRCIVTTSWDQTARLWDAGTGKSLLALLGHTDSVNSASFSPDGSRIVTASWDKTARLWDARTGKSLLTLQGHTDRVNSASFSSDGGRIVTTSQDKTARLWDAKSGKLLLTLQGHAAAVTGAGFSPDGRRIITASDDTTARLWSAGTEARGGEQLANLLRCRLPLRLEDGVVVPTALDPAGCESPPEAPPPPPRWDQRDSSLWAGVYALQAGNQEGARRAFQEARSSLGYFQDNLLLAKLDLAEAALGATEDAPCPAGVGERVRGAQRGEQAALWLELANFAHDELYRPRWGLWLLDQGLALGPSADEADLSATRTEVLLVTGQVAEVLQQGPEVWSAQTKPTNKNAVAALIWIAAGLQDKGRERQSWAVRVMQSYVHLEDGVPTDWTFFGCRHAFLSQPDSQVRTQALALFTLLEQPKSAETIADLARLLALPAPRPAPPKP